MIGNDRNLESEIRIKIRDISIFKKKLKELNATIIKEYRFIDEIYYPLGNIDWNIEKKSIRIRTYINSENISKILFSHINLKKIDDFQFKQSLYPGGKLPLFSGI